jgi:transposase
MSSYRRGVVRGMSTLKRGRIRVDGSPRTSVNGIAKMLVTADHCLLSPALEKAQYGFDFGTHVARWEVPGSIVLFQIGAGDVQ